MTRLMLAVLSLLVPAHERPRWREEWLAESSEVRTRRGRVAAVRMSAGALRDARATRALARNRKQGRRRAPWQGAGEDLRYAWRNLIKERAFAAGVIASLSFGIASMVTGFTFAEALTVRPFPGVRDQHALVQIRATRHSGGHQESLTTTIEEHQAFSGLPGLESLAGQSNATIAVTIRG